MTELDERLRDEAARAGIHRLVAGAVVHHDGRILILRRSPADDFLPGIEELPSGGVEAGEDLLTALAREMAEEIGWSGPVPIEDGFAAHFDYTSGSGSRVRQYTFSVPWDGHPIVLSAEHTAYRWLAPAGLGDIGDTGDIGYTGLTDESLGVIRAWIAR